MNALAVAVIAALDDEALDALAELLRPRLGLEQNGRCRWMTVPEAAEYIRAKPQRVYDLISQGRLPAGRDGTRRLLARDDLDSYLEAARR